MFSPPPVFENVFKWFGMCFLQCRELLVSLLACLRPSDLTKTETTFPIMIFVDHLFSNNVVFEPHPFECFDLLNEFIDFTSSTETKIIDDAIMSQAKTWVCGMVGIFYSSNLLTNQNMRQCGCHSCRLHSNLKRIQIKNAGKERGRKGNVWLQDSSADEQKLKNKRLSGLSC